MKVQAESFHLNGHIVGFHPQIQKFESPYKTPTSTLTVKGLKMATTVYEREICIIDRTPRKTLGFKKKNRLKSRYIPDHHQDLYIQAHPVKSKKEIVSVRNNMYLYV